MTRFVGATAAATLVLVAACGGGGGNANGVASLGGSGSGSGAHSSGGPSTTASHQNVSQLYARWAQCMRDHGINIADPVVDDQGQINITVPQGVSMDTFKNADGACTTLHTAAQNAARGGRAPQKPDPSRLVNFSKCMRRHGLPDFPDPSGNGLQIQARPGSDLSPDNPAFQAAQRACQSLLGSMKGGERVTGGGGGGPTGTKG
jgi:hypothetical protein